MSMFETPINERSLMNSNFTDRVLEIALNLLENELHLTLIFHWA